MAQMMKSYETIDEYIANFSPGIQEKLQQMRRTIAEAAPEAKEKISYGIPTFTLHGNLVHFGGYDTHIGFYPGPVAIAEFKDRLVSYDTAKGTIKFPLDKPLPLDLIRDITLVCIERNIGKR
jgi:uncharacterized protein YdhG (YjbR/CyaY superfamily)